MIISVIEKQNFLLKMLRTYLKIMKIFHNGGCPVKKLVICTIAAAFFMLPFVFACNAQKKTDQASDTKALFDKKCSACHNTKKATSQKKTQPEWADTVLRMKNKNGAPVNEEEAKTIIAFLTENYGK